MKCYDKSHCYRGYLNCCADCEVKFMCEHVCSPDAIRVCNYREKMEELLLEQEEREKAMKKENRIVTAILVLILLITVIFAIGMHLQYEEYKEEIKSGLPVAADQSAMSSKEDKSSTNYSISNLEVMSNDRYCNRSNHR